MLESIERYVNKASLGLRDFALLLFKIVIDHFSKHSMLKLSIQCIPHNCLSSLKGTHTAPFLSHCLVLFVYGLWAKEE